MLHVALRASKDTTINSDGKNVVPDVWQVLDKIKEFSDKVRNGSWVKSSILNANLYLYLLIIYNIINNSFLILIRLEPQGNHLQM